MTKKMYVDVNFAGEPTAVCTLDLEKPGAKIEVSGEGAKSIEWMLRDGMHLVEDGKHHKLIWGKDDIKIMSSMFRMISGSYWRASVAYFDGEKPVDPY